MKLFRPIKTTLLVVFTLLYSGSGRATDVHERLSILNESEDLANIYEVQKPASGPNRASKAETLVETTAATKPDPHPHPSSTKDFKPHGSLLELTAGDSSSNEDIVALQSAVSSLLGPVHPEDDLYFYLMGLVQLRKGNIPSARKSFNKALVLSVGPGDETVRLKTLLSLFELEKEEENYLVALEYITEYYKIFERVKAHDSTNLVKDAVDSLALKEVVRSQSTSTPIHWPYYVILTLLVLLMFTTALLFRDRLIPGWLPWNIPWLQNFEQSATQFVGLNKSKWPDDSPTNKEDAEDGIITVDEAKIEKLIKLRSMSLLTEDQWEEFKAIFDTIYPDLFIRLLENRKSLTLSDEKLVCLLRLHCNTQEIANRLGISQNSANTARSRLRKRLGLQHHEYIEEFLLKHSTPNSFDETYRKRKS